MEEREDKRGGAGCAIGCVVLILMVVVYVLSIGPALWLHWRGFLPAGFLRIYAPLQWVVEFYDPFNDFLTWYKNLFRPEPVLIR